MKFASVLLTLLAISTSTALAAPHKGGFRKEKGKKNVKRVPQNLDDAGSSNATAIASSVNSTDVSSSANSTDTSDVTGAAAVSAGSSTPALPAGKNRPCDQGDQSLAASLSSAVIMGMGLQASVLTLQNISSQATFDADGFNDGVTRLQQFQDTFTAQIQAATTIADDDSFAQPQIKLLTAAVTSNAAAIKQLSGITSAAQATAAAGQLSTLLAGFLSTTNDAQDGSVLALADCFLPLATVSG